MVFWILVGAILVLSSLGFLDYKSQGNNAVAAFFITAVVSSFAGFFILCIIMLFAPSTNSIRSTEHSPLKELKTASLNSDSFYLGTTYNSDSDSRVVNFISIEGDGNKTWNMIRNVPANESRVFEDETKAPYLLEKVKVYDNPWLLPWTIDTGSRGYDFHIPKNSVVEDYKNEN